MTRYPEGEDRSMVETMLKLMYQVEMATGKDLRQSGEYAFVMAPKVVLEFIAECCAYGWVPRAQTQDGLAGAQGRFIGWFHDVPILERDDAPGDKVYLVRLEDMASWDNAREGL